MDTKKQEKLKEEVWRFVMNGKPSRIEEQWIVNPLKKKLGKDADIDLVTKTDAPKGPFPSLLMACIEKNNLPSSEYEYISCQNEPFPARDLICQKEGNSIRWRWKLYPHYATKLTYCGKEIIFSAEPMERGYQYIYIPYLDTFFNLPRFNVKALLDFMKTGMDEMLEEYEFKRNYYIHFAEHFLEAEMKKKINLVSAGNFSFNRLWDLFRIEDEIKADYNKEIRKNERVPEFPIAPTAKYNPEGEVIMPLKERMLQYAENGDKIDIVSDQNNAAGFIIKMNESVAYLKLGDNNFQNPIIYFEPSRMCVFVEAFGGWNYIAPRLYYGLKRCKLLIRLYEDYCRVFEATPNHFKLWMMENLVDDMPPCLSNHPICDDDMSPKWGFDLDVKKYYEDICIELKNRGRYTNAEIKKKEYGDGIYLNVEGYEIDLTYGNSQFAVGYQVKDVKTDVDKIEYGLDLINRNKYLSTVLTPDLEGGKKMAANNDLEGMKMAANNGNTDAMIALGCYFLREWETNPNAYNEAAEWFIKALESKDSRALMKVAYHNLSVMYADGLGVVQDKKKSRDYAKARDEIVLPLRKKILLYHYVRDYTSDYIEEIKRIWSIRYFE